MKMQLILSGLILFLQEPLYAECGQHSLDGLSPAAQQTRAAEADIRRRKDRYSELLSRLNEKTRHKWIEMERAADAFFEARASLAQMESISGEKAEAPSRDMIEASRLNLLEDLMAFDPSLVSDGTLPDEAEARLRTAVDQQSMMGGDERKRLFSESQAKWWVYADRLADVYGAEWRDKVDEERLVRFIRFRMMEARAEELTQDHPQ